MSRGEPGGIRLIAEGRPAVVVKPVKVVAVAGLPDKVGRAGVLHLPCAGSVGHELRLGPPAAGVARVGMDWIVGRGAVDREEAAVRESDDALLLRDVADGRAQADVAVGQRFPPDFCRIALRQKVVAAQGVSLRFRHEGGAEVADLVQGDIGGALMDQRAADTPEATHFAAIDVSPVDRGFSDRDFVALLGPRLAVIVAIFENEIAPRIDALLHHAVDTLHFPQIVLVVVVERVEPAGRRLQHGDIGKLRWPRRIDRDQGRPRAAEVGAPRRNDVLAGRAFVAARGGDNADPGPVVGLHDVGLIGIVFGRYCPASGDVAPIHGNAEVRLGRGGSGHQGRGPRSPGTRSKADHPNTRERAMQV